MQHDSPVQFNVSVSPRARIAIYARQTLKPTLTLHNYIETIRGDHLHISGIARRQKRESESSESLSKSALVQFHLLPGKWYLGFFNDGLYPEPITFVATTVKKENELSVPEASKTCKYDCFSKGVCKDGKCHCHTGFSGEFCEESKCIVAAIESKNTFQPPVPFSVVETVSSPMESVPAMKASKDLIVTWMLVGVPYRIAIAMESVAVMGTVNATMGGLGSSVTRKNALTPLVPTTEFVKTGPAIVPLDGTVAVVNNEFRVLVLLWISTTYLKRVINLLLWGKSRMTSLL